MFIWIDAVAGDVEPRLVRAGRACAPIAAGRPKPMVPSPPELIQRRGSLKS